MISSKGYIVVVGHSWQVVDAWHQDHPDQPFVGVRVDGVGVWVAVEPRIAAGSLQAAVIAEIESALEATGRDTWADDKDILCEARSVRE